MYFKDTKIRRINLKKTFTLTCMLYLTLLTGCTDHTKEYSEMAKKMIHATCNIQYNRFKNEPLDYYGYINSKEVQGCTKYFLKNYAPADILDQETKRLPSTRW